MWGENKQGIIQSFPWTLFFQLAMWLTTYFLSGLSSSPISEAFQHPVSNSKFFLFTTYPWQFPFTSPCFVFIWHILPSDILFFFFWCLLPFECNMHEHEHFTLFTQSVFNKFILNDREIPVWFLCESLRYITKVNELFSSKLPIIQMGLKGFTRHRAKQDGDDEKMVLIKNHGKNHLGGKKA